MAAPQMLFLRESVNAALGTGAPVIATAKVENATLPAINDPNLSHYGTAFNATGVTE